MSKRHAETPSAALGEPKGTGRHPGKGSATERLQRRKNGRASEGPAPAAPYQPTAAEAAAIASVEAKRNGRAPLPTLKLAEPRPGVCQVGRDHPDPDVWHSLLEHSFGVRWGLGQMLVEQIAGLAVVDAKGDATDRANQMVAAIATIEPADGVEAMLAMQMVGVQRAALDCLRRGQLDGQTMEARAMNLSQANKLARTFAALTEALSRHRGKATQQRVTVEHVHVHSGGKAIVGAVGGTGRHPEGEGDNRNDDGQPHALGAALPSPDTAGDALPVASGEGAPALSHARRR